MAFHHRKLLLIPRIISENTTLVIKDTECRDDCLTPFDDSLSPPPPPPLPPPPGDQSNSNLPISPILILMFCLLVGIFFLFCYLTIVKRYRSDLNTFWRRTVTNLDQTREDFIEENHGQELVHPIWLINTIGLQQSIIDSIAIFKYKKDEGLTEGTDCSVCLSEFQEDESLRLLPKCSHAFHISCIDTWLRSHKNCPLCRAPIVCDTNNSAGVSTVEREDNTVEYLERHGELGEDIEANEMRVGDENFGAMLNEQGNVTDILEKSLFYLNARNSEFRVKSDLGDQISKVGGELHPVRRSISMDSSSASMIYLAIANNVRPIEEQEGISCTELLQAKKGGLENISKQGNLSNSSIHRIMNGSFGRSKRQEFMNRSISSTGNCSNARSSRSQDSIPPL